MKHLYDRGSHYRFWRASVLSVPPTQRVHRFRGNADRGYPCRVWREGTKAADALERDESPETQAEVIRLLLRYSIANINANLFESGKVGLETYEKTKAKQWAEQASENPF